MRLHAQRRGSIEMLRDRRYHVPMHRHVWIFAALLLACGSGNGTTDDVSPFDSTRPDTASADVGADVGAVDTSDSGADTRPANDVAGDIAIDAIGDATFDAAVDAPGDAADDSAAAHDAGGASFDDVDDQLPWQTCGNCANTGATGATAFTEFNATTVQSEDGHAVENAVGEALNGSAVNHPAYGDAYWWKEHGALPSQVLSVDYWLDVYIPATNFAGMPTTPQAIEFEVQQTRGNVVYNFAWQCDYAQNQWRVFQYGGPGAGQWLPSGIAGSDFPSGSVRLATGIWHQFHAHYHVDPSTTPATIVHDYLAIDGVQHNATTTVNAWPVSGTPRSDQFSNAVQFDMNSVACTAGSSTSCRLNSSGSYTEGTPYHVYWDKVRVVVGY